MSAFEDVVEAWGFKVAGDKPVVLSPAGIAPDGSIIYSDAESFRDLIGAEPELGSPSVNGWILSSSSAGVRSWVAPNAHSHAIADVTGLQAALDGKEPILGNPSASGHVLASTTAGVRSWVAPYALPTASASILGGVKVGAGLSIASGVLSVSYGTVAGSACQGNDSRLSDARTPLSHVHAIADVTGLQSALDARMATASYPDLVAIEALAGTSGLLRKTATNTWSLDTASYLTTAGTAAAATKLATGRTIGITGDATWTSPAFDGTANVTAAITLASVITAAGPIGSGTTVPVITYDAKGRVTEVTTAAITPAGIGAAAAAHNHTLDSLSNTTITSIATGEILKWNGTAWVNATLSEAGIQPAGSYLTGNQTITLSGVVTGSGTTAITTSIADGALSIAKTNGLQAELDGRVSIAASRVTHGTYVNPATDAMSLAARHSAGYGVHFGRWYSIAEAPRTGYFNFVMLPETKTGNIHNTLAFSNTDAIEAYVGRGSNSGTETWRRIWTDGDFSSSAIAYWNNKQDALGYTPVNKAGDSGIGSLTLTYGQRVKAGVDVDPTLSNAYSQAPLVAEREAVSGSTYAAGIGFHNRGTNGAFLYYAPEGGGFKFTRNTGTNATLWDSSNLDAVVKNPAAEQKITSHALVVERSATNQAAFAAWIAGDTLGRVALRSDGAVEWGNGAVARDTNLYRAAANMLKTDDVFFSAGGFRSTGYQTGSIGGTGPGVEVHYDSESSRARVLAYDRTAAARIPLAIDGSPINFCANSVLKGSFDAYGNFNLVNATASRVAVFDSSKNLVSSSVTTEELRHLSGVTSAIQTQFSGKASTIDANYGYTMEGTDPFASRGSFGGNGGVRTWNGAGPFGSVWYNVVDVRHRNSWNTNDVYGGELAWGMTRYTDRLAFRSRNGAGTPGAWTEVWTSANLSSPASLTANNTWTGVNTFSAATALNGGGTWNGSLLNKYSSGWDGKFGFEGNAGVSTSALFHRPSNLEALALSLYNPSNSSDSKRIFTISCNDDSPNTAPVSVSFDVPVTFASGSTVNGTVNGGVVLSGTSRLDISVSDVTLPDAPVGTMVVVFNTSTADRRIYASSGTLIISTDILRNTYEQTNLLVNRGVWLLVRGTSTRWVTIGAI